MWGYYDAYTAAQIELMMADAPLVVYDRKSRKNKKKGGSAIKEKPRAANVSEAAERWKEKYGDDGKKTEKRLDLSGYRIKGKHTKQR